MAERKYKAQKLPSGNYRVQKRLDKKVVSFTFDHNPTQKEIRQAIFEAQLNNNTATISSSFKECADKYIAIKEHILSPSTIKLYRGMLNNLPVEFTALPMYKITQIECQGVINDIAAKCSPKTTANYNGFIMSVINEFNQDARFKIKLPQKKKPDDYIPSSEEVKKILDASKGTMWYIVFMLGAYGLRRSEIIALTLDDFHDGYVDINKTKVISEYGFVTKNIGKTSTSLRLVPISDELTNLVMDQGYVYNQHPSRILIHLHRYQDEVGVPRFKFHLLRHFYCTELSQAGFSEEDIMALGGWATPHVMKKVYRHNRIKESEEAQRKAADQIQKLFK